MRTVIAILAAALLAVGAALAVVLSGLPDVAAASRHSAAARWLLSTAMERSVRRRARDVAPPPSLEDPTRLAPGFAAYDDLCAGCHGTPGAEPGVIAVGLEPEPPRLADDPGGWSDAERFWILRNGVRMTGMPAFGATHSDDELWDVVAFLRRLPTLSQAEYGALREERAARPSPGHGHGHGHGHSHGHGHDHGKALPPASHP